MLVVKKLKSGGEMCTDGGETEQNGEGKKGLDLDFLDSRDALRRRKCRP